MPLSFSNYTDLFPPVDERDEPLSNTGVVEALSSSAFINKIQYGTVTLSSTSGTATITSVDTSNSLLILNGARTSVSSADMDWHDFAYDIVLSDSTTVTATRVDSEDIIYINFCVIEFEEGVLESNQQGTITLIPNVSSNTATISEVATTSSMLSFLGSVTDDTNGLIEEADENIVTIELTNSTTITAQRGNGGLGTPTVIARYQLVEFK